MPLEGAYYVGVFDARTARRLRLAPERTPVGGARAEAPGSPGDPSSAPGPSDGG